MATAQRWSVWWRDKGHWSLFRSGLSRRAADSLAKRVTYVLAPRWGLPNVPTTVVPDGTTVD